MTQIQSFRVLLHRTLVQGNETMDLTSMWDLSFVPFKGLQILLAGSEYMVGRVEYDLGAGVFHVFEETEFTYVDNLYIELEEHKKYGWDESCD